MVTYVNYSCQLRSEIIAGQSILSALYIFFLSKNTRKYNTSIDL